MKTALVVGATGLVGGFVLAQLLKEEQYNKIIVLTRKPLSIHHSKIKEVLVDFDKLQQSAEHLKADVVFCCLGTTIKAAGSQAAFKKVDFEYPLQIAKIAKQNGATSFLIITAMGASKDSFIFYNKVKGEIEQALQKLNFDVLHIIQPSLIIGERNEHRLGESIAKKLSPIYNSIMRGPLKKYKAIEAAQIAKAMIYFSKENAKGVQYHTNDKLLEVQ